MHVQTDSVYGWERRQHNTTQKMLLDSHVAASAVHSAVCPVTVIFLLHSATVCVVCHRTVAVLRSYITVYQNQ